MKCEKCGKELDENAVFCDGCGAFVMHGEYNMLPNNGYRKRKERMDRIWIIILISALIAGILGMGIGYGIIEKDRREREMRMFDNSNKSKKVIWDGYLTDKKLYR